jgi:SAM-dependent methyltransferase
MTSRRAVDQIGQHADQTDAQISEVLAELEGAQNYKRWLLELVGPHVRGNVLEVGAGRGTYSCELRALGTRLTAVEPSEQGSLDLRQRVGDLADTTVVVGTLADVDDHSFDTAIMFNVLEHIDGDIEVLQQIHDRLTPGGSLCIWVPAFPLLFGRFDRRIGHHRRYRKNDLVARTGQAGFEIVDARYANMPGFFAWLLVVRVLGWSPTTGGMSGIYDRFVVPIARAVERRVRPPFGQSLLVVARKPAGSAA